MGDAASAYTDYIGHDKIGYLTYALDIAPSCDCVPGSDRSVIPNLGVFASRDLVSIDLAALDMSTKAKIYAYKYWQENDGTKEGLLRLIESQS